MSNVPLPRPGPLGLIQYAGVDMREYAAAVSAAKDADIAGLRAELLKSLADNAPLREQVRVLEDALRAMLTHMGMDEDEWNKPTFDQARAALEQKP